MKTIFISLFLIISSIFVYADNFYVIRVEGRVTVDNKELKTGDKLNEESMLSFSSDEDKIYLLSPNDGYFLITPAEQEKESKEWVVALKKAIIPQNKYYMTATRGAVNFSSFEDVYDLMGFFRDRVLIIDETTFSFNPEKIPLDEKNYFSFKNLKGNKDLNFKSNKNTFSILGQYDNDEFELTYVTPEENKKIGTFLLTTKSGTQISRELAVFFNNDNKQNSSAVYFEQVVPYISEVYGNTNLEVIKNIIDTDLNIKLVNK